MKKLLIKIIKLLFYPLTKPTINNLRLKDIVFLNPLEHLLRAVEIIKADTFSNNNGSVILDIGVANGGTCLFFNKNFPNCKIYGYEPIPESFKEASLRCKNINNITINNIAFSDVEEQLELNITSNLLSSSILSINNKEVNKYPKDHKNKFSIIKKEIINTKILDIEAESFEKILLIKIDTQGSEYKILSKGIKTLKKTKYILIEMNNHKLYNKGCQYYDIDGLLRQNNFKLVDIVVTYRDRNHKVVEYDALYENIL